MVHFHDAAVAHTTVVRTTRLESHASLTELAIPHHPVAPPAQLQIELFDISGQWLRTLRDSSRVRRHRPPVAVRSHDTDRVEYNSVKVRVQSISKPRVYHARCRDIHAEAEQHPCHHTTQEPTGV